MAKTIKFNLICDEKPIRTIEDLQHNFSVEDVLEYYNNRMLHRWLRVRGYDSELQKVNAITSDDHMEIIKSLIAIFHIAADEKDVEESVYALRHTEERRQILDMYERRNYESKNVIASYEAGYRLLVEEILENPKDAALIKANISELATNYAWVFELNHREVFNRLWWSESYLAVMCLLMNENTRPYYLPIRTVHEDGSVSLDTEKNDDKRVMFNRVCQKIKDAKFIEILKDHIITFAGETDGYWKDLEPKGKKYMIIHMGQGDYVRAAGHSGGDLSAAAIKEQFVILDGIDYKSNSNSRMLIYMEV